MNSYAKFIDQESGHILLDFGTLDRSRSHGALHLTEEVSLAYDVDAGAWVGDVLNSDGWFDLDEAAAMEFAEKTDFVQAVCEYLDSGR